MTEKMHILHVITKCDYGGAQTVVRELATEQLGRGHQVSIVTGVVGPVSEQLTTLGVRVDHEATLTHSIHLQRDRVALRHLVDRMSELRPDVVHAHSSKGGLLGRQAARRLDIPAIYTAHGWPFQRGAAPLQRLASFVGEWASARSSGPVVCVTAADLALARRSHVCPPDRLRLVHNGIGHADDRRPTLQDGGTALRLLMVARFAAPKRQDLVVQALAWLPSDVRLTLAGDGPTLDAVRRLAAPYGDRVQFVGVAPPAALLAVSDALVLASDYEGLPMSVLEGMRAGLPIVANRLRGLSDAVRDGETGLLCELTPQSLAAAILTLRDATFRARLGDAGRAAWTRQFTADTMADRYDEVYAAAARD